MQISKHIDKPRKRAYPYFPLIAFGVAILILLIVYAMRGIFPFGSNSLLKIDLYHQYAPFHEELRNRLLNGQGLLYSWEGGLGKQFLPQLAYYTASPLSLLILLFPSSVLPQGMTLLISLKLALCAATFTFYLQKRHQTHDVCVIAFGLAYAFCAFMTAYYWNVMWLDGLALFPLLALGVENLVREKHCALYLSMLALTILVNFYLAFLICIMICLYFVVCLLSRYHIRKDFRRILKICLRFAVCSLLAGGISAVLTLPSAIALGQTATSSSTMPAFEVYHNIWQMLSGHFLGARPVVLARNSDLPNIYCGVLTMLLAPFFFISRRIALREKLLYGGALVFLTLCSIIKPLDYLIHGAHFPANLPHRFSFVYSFLLLTMAYRIFRRIRGIHLSMYGILAAIYIGGIILCEFVFEPRIEDASRVLSNFDIGLNVAVLLLYSICLWFCAHKRTRKRAVAVLLLFSVAECTFSTFEATAKTTSTDNYVKFVPSTAQALQYIHEQNPEDFYRTEFRRLTTINDGALYHYHGINEFSSMAPGGVMELIGNLGIASSGNSCRYYDPTPLVDAMLGISYVMNKDDDGNGQMKNERYEYLNTFGNISVYRNPQSLPLGFMVSDNIVDWDTTHDNPFVVQNSFLYHAAGVREKMLTNISLSEISGTNLSVTDHTNKNQIKYKLTDASDLDRKPSLTIKITAQEDQYLYLYFNSPNTKRVKFTTSVSGKDEDRELAAGNSLFDIGSVEKDEIITVTLDFINRGEFEPTYRETGTVKMYAAAYHSEVFNDAYTALAANPLTLSQWGDGYLTGTVYAPQNQTLFLSIPYIQGWNATVDGVAAEIIPIGENGLMGIVLDEGEHTVSLRFTTPGLRIGFFITLVSLLLAGAFLLLDHRRRIIL